MFNIDIFYCVSIQQVPVTTPDLKKDETLFDVEKQFETESTEKNTADRFPFCGRPLEIFAFENHSQIV